MLRTNLTKKDLIKNLLTKEEGLKFIFVNKFLMYYGFEEKRKVICLAF